MSIRNLRRIAELAQSGEPIPASDAEWLAGVVRAYEAVAPEGGTLDRVAGLVPPRGGESWWHAERRRMRNAALRGLAADFHAGLSVTKAATAIQAQIRRYESHAWLQDRELNGMPVHYLGTPSAHLFAAFKAMSAPSSIRQIASILSGDDD